MRTRVYVHWRPWWVGSCCRGPFEPRPGMCTCVALLHSVRPPLACAPHRVVPGPITRRLSHTDDLTSMCPITVTPTPPSPPATQNTHLEPHRSPASSLGCACTCKISPTVLTRNCARAHRWRTYMCAHAVAIQPSRPPTLSLSLSLSHSRTRTGARSWQQPFKVARLPPANEPPTGGSRPPAKVRAYGR